MLGPEYADRTHVVWGFAKDFGLSGLKVGVLHTSHPEIRSAARALAYFAPVSTDTQLVLREMLASHGWVANYLPEHRRRLGDSYHRAGELLAEQGIPHVPAGAGFSVWADLRDRLAAGSFTAEQALWWHIWEAARVNILPGGAFGCPEPGWFRICHTVDPVVVRAGITRLGECLSAVGPVGGLRAGQGS